MPALRVMTFNVLYGALHRERLVADVVRSVQPHIAVFTEAQDTAAFAIVADAVGPHRAAAGHDTDRARVMIVSRWPILDSRPCGPAWSPRKWIRATIQPFEGPPLTIIGVCLFPQLLAICELWRLLEMGALGRCLPASATPALIAGDFNALSPGDRHSLTRSPWWVRAQWIAQGGWMPRWAMSRMAATGYADCFRACNGADDGFTVPSWDPQARIDYIFASPGLRPALRSAGTPLSGAASDHLAVWADFDWGRRLNAD